MPNQENFIKIISKLHEKIKDAKNNHVLINKIIGATIVTLPHPFNNFAKIVWDGLDQETENYNILLIH